ncbi:hypothetical protein OAS67_08805 [Alphaproteobacteria bacterium]|nr:hypothetical protein [Alphaproteobacteria bacterium]
MRSAIYGVIFTAFFASAGIVQAGELDGKALFCSSTNTLHPFYGLVFDQGKVTRLEVEGFFRSIAYFGRKYKALGTRYIRWRSNITLDRHTLMVGRDQCSISSETDIFQKLDEIIAVAKRTNKI